MLKPPTHSSFSNDITIHYVNSLSLTLFALVVPHSILSQNQMLSLCCGNHRFVDHPTSVIETKNEAVCGKLKFKMYYNKINQIIVTSLNFFRWLFSPVSMINSCVYPTSKLMRSYIEVIVLINWFMGYYSDLWQSILYWRQWHPGWKLLEMILLGAFLIYPKLEGG